MTLTRRDVISSIAAVGGQPAATAVARALGLAPSSHLQYRELKFAGAGQGTEVVVLGAGIAGLVTAYELKRAGFRVRVLEARRRVGGRNWTVRHGDTVEYLDGRRQQAQFAPGLYFNAGPARLPSQHRTLLDYCSELKVPLEVLVNSSHGARLRPNLDKPAFSVRQAQNDARGHLSSLLAKAMQRDALDEELTAEDRTRLLTFLRSYGDLSETLVYEGSVRAGHGVARSHPGAAASFGTPLALDRLLHPGLWDALLDSEFPEFSTTMFQPVGGMDRIAQAFAKNLESEIQLGAEVCQLYQEEGGVRVTYRDAITGDMQVVRGEYLVSTLPLALLARLDTDFSVPFKTALNMVRNGQATKVAWQAPRFWEREDRIYGGLSWLNHIARVLWYPSNDFNSQQGLLVAGYLFAPDSGTFASKSFEEQYALSAQAVELLHPGHAQSLRHPLAISWEQIRFSEGPWLNVENFSAQAHQLLEQPQGRVYLASDNLGQNGIGIWQETAANAARQVVGQLAERVIHQRRANLAY